MSSSSSWMHLALRDHRNQAQYAPFSFYGYLPTFGTCVAFLVLFGLSTIIHLVQAVKTRGWYLLITLVLAGMLECMGWSGRIWSTFNLRSQNSYIVQITGTAVASTPFIAGSFMIFARIIAYLGPQYSRISPKFFSLIFITADVTALTVQGVGGGLAIGVGITKPKTMEVGRKILLGGICLQFVTMTVFIALALEFFYRYAHNIPLRGRRAETNASSSSSTIAESTTLKRVFIMSYAVGFTTVCLWIRGVYRILSINGGWTGRIITTQVYFNVLDAGMAILEFVAYNIIHPGMFLPDESATASMSTTVTPGSPQEKDTEVRVLPHVYPGSLNNASASSDVLGRISTSRYQRDRAML